MSTETEIKKSIIDGISKHMPGISVFKVISGAVSVGKFRVTGAPKGTPDLCGFLPDGRFLGIEVKTNSGTFSREQYEFLAKAAKAKAVVICATSWADCAKQLHEIIHADEIKDGERYAEIEDAEIERQLNRRPFADSATV